jgi:hypothetical protein
MPSPFLGGIMKVGDIIDGKRITKVFYLCGLEAYQTEPIKSVGPEPIKAEEEPDFMPEPEPIPEPEPVEEEPEVKAEPVIKKRGGRKKKE